MVRATSFLLHGRKERLRISFGCGEHLPETLGLKSQTLIRFFDDLVKLVLFST
jgi:hypothetical protein